MVVGDARSETKAADGLHHALLTRSGCLREIDLVPRTTCFLTPSLGHVVPEEAQEQTGGEFGDALGRMSSSPISPTSLASDPG